jgi:hypothetical protein
MLRLQLILSGKQLTENIKISAKESLGYYELKQDKPWFDEGCSKLLDQRKQAKLQWLQDPSEINGDNLKNVRPETSTHFRNKKREYPKGKINELAMNIKNKNIRDLYRGMNEFKRGYRPRSNIDTINKNTKTLSDASKEVGLEVNVENMLVSQDQNAGQNREIKIGDRPFEGVSQVKYLGTAVKK